MKTEDFIKKVQRMAGDPDYTDEEILDIATHQLQSRVFPHLMKLNDGFYTREERVTIKAGTDRVQMPPYGLSDSYTDVRIKHGTALKELVRVQPSMVDEEDHRSRPKAFYFLGGAMVFDCIADADYELRFIYTYRPPKLVLSTSTVTFDDAYELPVTPQDQYGSRISFEERSNSRDTNTVLNAAGAGDPYRIAFWDTLDSCELIGYGVASTRQSSQPWDFWSGFVVVENATANWAKQFNGRGDISMTRGHVSAHIPVPNTYLLLLQHLVVAALMRDSGDYEAARVHQEEVAVLTETSSVKGRQGSNHRLLRNVWY